METEKRAQERYCKEKEEKQRKKQRKKQEETPTKIEVEQRHGKSFKWTTSSPHWVKVSIQPRLLARELISPTRGSTTLTFGIRSPI